MFKIAVDWLVNHGEMVIPVSYLTTIHGILDHLTSSRTKTQFIHGLLKGCGANLSSSSLKAFGQMVCRIFYPPVCFKKELDNLFLEILWWQLLLLSVEKVPNAENPFLCVYDSKTDSLGPVDPSVFNYTADEQHSFDNLVEFRESIVPTWSLQVAYTMIRPWLLSKDHHIMLVGPEACGKR